MKKIIGREKELQELEEAYQSDNAEFIAVYGRWRVGKTFLVTNSLSNREDTLFFHISGTKKGTKAEQIKNFTDEISDKFLKPGARIESPKTWRDALRLLTEYIKDYKGKKVVLFFDEFPWLVSKRSELMETFQFHWNRHWSLDDRIKLIVCGSSAGWILEKIINDRDGLYNRVTHRIHLEPFNLHETKEYLRSRGASLQNRDITNLYMVLGGIPFYLSQTKTRLSAMQNIEFLAFRKNSFLMTEFDNLYATLFSEDAGHIELAKIISKHRYGINRKNIVAASPRFKKGGRLTTLLKDLEQAGFISRFTPFESKKKEAFYKMEDEYSLFYFNWIEPIRETPLARSMKIGYWEQELKSPAWHSWAGYAFEALCIKHISQISEALGISVTAKPHTWRYVPPKGSLERGAQVDLLFDRDDNSITLCEIKYTREPFILDKEQMHKLWNRIDVFKQHTKTQKNIFLSFISAQGLKKTVYSEEFVHQIVSLEDLFKKNDDWYPLLTNSPYDYSTQDV